MKLALIQNALGLAPPIDYFRGYTPDEICIPRNIILFSRKTMKDLQRRSFDGYPHHRFVLIFNLMTKGTIVIDGVQWRLEPGQGFLVFPYQFQQFIELEDPSIIWLFITFELEGPAVMDTFRHRVLNLENKTEELLTRVIEDFQGEKDERGKRRLTLDLASLIDQLRQQASTSPRAKMEKHRLNSPRNDSLITQIQDYLSKNLGALHNISRIAQHMNMSESNLRTSFRQKFNISLGSYLKNYRAHQAILLMQNSKLSLTEIAFIIGFTTLSAFSRFFTNTIGVSPKVYRNNLNRPSET